jgi:hypothetical protein
VPAIAAAARLSTRLAASSAATAIATLGDVEHQVGVDDQMT